MKYRRRRLSDTVHDCRNCSNWPKRDYVEYDRMPTKYEGCNQCGAKKKRGQCTPNDSAVDAGVGGLGW